MTEPYFSCPLEVHVSNLDQDVRTNYKLTLQSKLFIGIDGSRRPEKLQLFLNCSVSLSPCSLLPQIPVLD